MKTRNFTRITAALLSFLMLCSVLACGKADTGEEATTTTALTTTAATASETTAEPQGDDLPPSITDDLPADLKFNNEVVTFLYREEVAGEFYSEAANGDIINDAVYESILAVEERLGVDIQTITRKGQTTDVRDEYLKHIVNQTIAGDDTYDWVDQMANFSGTQAVNGIYCNLLNLDYINLNKPWYISNMKETVTICDRLFFVAGDVSLGYLKSAFCIYYNRDKLEELNLEDPEELVRNGSWTLEKLKTYAIAGGQDLNSDGQFTLDDQLGFVSHDANHPRGFVASTGIDLYQKNADGSHTYIFGGERDHAACTALYELKKSTPGIYFYESTNAKQEGLADYAKISDMFIGGKIMMISAEMDDVIACGYHGMEDSYGVLPYPKLNEEQEQYRTSSRTTHNTFSMPITCKDPDMAAAVIEALSAVKYTKVRPTYCDVALKTKYSEDAEAAEIFDIIHGSMVLEFGYVYANNMSGVPMNLVLNLMNDVSRFSSAVRAESAMMEKLYNKMIKAIEEKCEE